MLLYSQVKTKATDGYTALQLGAGERKWKNVNKAQTEIFRRVGVNPKRKVTFFTCCSFSPCFLFLFFWHSFLLLAMLSPPDDCLNQNICRVA